MNTGPRARAGYDLVLTEVTDGGDHFFLLDAGSALGEELLKSLPCREAEQAKVSFADHLLRTAESRMGRSLQTEGLREALREGFEHPRWNEVAKRCLACANCTMVCPTCFCSTVEDTTDLSGEHAERVRRWDSCFTTEFTRIAGGNIRMSTRTRYRQWLTHKLGNWVDQFGTMGCVGCGRCITWCPVGIDITREAAAIRTGATVSTPA
jgi:ferredoxin